MLGNMESGHYEVVYVAAISAGQLIMIFDIYGRFEIEIISSGNGWKAFRRGNGIKAPYPDLVFPKGLAEADIPEFLDDHFHEYAQPGREIRRIESL